jgi:hypothetical protein
MNFNYIVIAFAFLIFNSIWIYAAKKENGTFTKQEAVQLMLGNMTLYMGLISGDEIKFYACLGSLLLSVGLSLYKK